jgi:hypothetical protein
VVVRL